MLCGSSTTQTTRGSRFGSAQYWQISPLLMLLQTLQMPSLSLTSRIACTRCSASSRPERITWNAMRCADFCPMPGRRLNSLMRRASGSAKSGMVIQAPLEHAWRQAHSAQHAAHLLLDLVVHLLYGLAGGGHDHVLQHLDITGNLGIDLHCQQVLLSIHLHRDHAAAGGGLHFDERDVLLQLLLHLLSLPHHLLHVAG